MPVKIFVGNLTSDTTVDDIRPLFEKFGTVTECDVLRNFGFVHMGNENQANAAIEELSGTLVKGQRINVEKSTGAPKGSSRGGGKMMGGRGRGFVGMRGHGGGPPYRGRFPDTDREYDPYGALRMYPYSRDPYGYGYYDYYYERSYPSNHPVPYGYPPDDRRVMYDRDRLPLPRDYYDRYSARYPLPTDRYAAYDRYPPRPAADPYERPSPDYYRYRAYDGYEDPVRSKASEQPEHIRTLGYGGDQLGMAPTYSYDRYCPQTTSWMTENSNPQGQQVRSTSTNIPVTMTDYSASYQQMGHPSHSNLEHHWQGAQQYP